MLQLPLLHSDDIQTRRGASASFNKRFLSFFIFLGSKLITKASDHRFA